MRRRGGLHLRDLLGSLIFLALLVLAAVTAREASMIRLAGSFSVIDGDSLAKGEERLRLEGVDAPELRQTCRTQDGSPMACGRDARRALQSFVESAAFACAGTKRDKYQRLLVTCHVAKLNVNRELVRRGFAVAYGNYDADEANARLERRGIWATDFERPQNWRTSHGGMEETPHIVWRVWFCERFAGMCEMLNIVEGGPEHEAL